jgi:dienelactone hydrolase
VSQFDLRTIWRRIDRPGQQHSWVIGAGLAASAAAGLTAALSSAKPPSFLYLAILALALGLGALLVTPSAPGLARAMRQLMPGAAGVRTSGPFAVDSFNTELVPPAGAFAPIGARIWYPAGSGRAPLASAAAHCPEAAHARRLPAAQTRFPILFYAPGNCNGRDDNASACASLASHGYVIIAIDDIDCDLPQRDGPGSAASRQPLVFDFSSNEAFEKTLREADRKVQLEAQKALAALAGLRAAAVREWQERLDFDHVGFFGFSIGGAAAAEAGVIDKRVVAVANLDGWLFGRAAKGALEKPFMVMNSDFPIPDARQLCSPSARKRNEAALTQRSLRELLRLASGRDGYWVWVKGSRHEGYCDRIFEKRFFMSWVLLDPARMRRIRDAYLLAFFDRYVRGIESPLLRRSPSPFAEAELLEDSMRRFGGIIEFQSKSLGHK